jgi:hypothetical protein
MHKPDFIVVSLGFKHLHKNHLLSLFQHSLHFVTTDDAYALEKNTDILNIPSP